MPDDINGNHSLTAGYKAVTGQKVLASQHNPPLEDISECLTARVNRHGNAPMLANLPMGGFKVTGLANGTVSTDAATKGQVDASMPIGSVIDFAGSTAPAGWLLCAGGSYLRADYPALFAAIGTTYGAFGGPTAFNVPDCRGRARVGKDDMGGTDAGRLAIYAAARILGGVLGAASHILTLAQLAAHTHPVSGSTSSGGAHSHSINSQPGGAGGGQFVSRSTTGSGTVDISPINSDGIHSHSISGTAGSVGSNEAHPNAQPSIVFNTIIKAL